MNDLSSDTKSVDDMMFDKVDHVGGFNFNERNSLGPLWEVIVYYKDEPMTFSWQRLIGPIISIPQALNGHDATVGWSRSGGV